MIVTIIKETPLTVSTSDRADPVLAVLSSLLACSGIGFVSGTEGIALRSICCWFCDKKVSVRYRFCI